MVVSITGGTSPYTITWSNGSVTSGISPQSINNLSAGTYSATIIDYWGDFTATTTCSIPKEAFDCKAVKLSLNSEVACDSGLGTGILTLTPAGGTSPYTFSGSVNGVPTPITNPLSVYYWDKINIIVIDYNGCQSSTFKTIVSCPSGGQPSNCTTTNCPNVNTFVFGVSATTLSNSVVFKTNLSSPNATSVRGSYKISNVDFPNTFLASPGVIDRKNYYNAANGAPEIELSNYLEIGFNQLTPTSLTNTDSPWELIVTPYPTFGSYIQPTPFSAGTSINIDIVLYDEDYCVHSGNGLIVLPNDTLTNTTSISF